MEKLHLIFLNHPWEESPLPWGHSTGVRKKSSRVIAISRVPHTAFSYGVHITKTTEQSFTGMFLIMYIFYFTLWFSCCFYFCDITFSFLHQKPGTEGKADPNCQKCWEGFYGLRQEFATFFSIQFLIRKHITPPPSWTSELYLLGLCIRTPPSTAGSNSFRHINKQFKWCVFFRNWLFHAWNKEGF